MTVATKDKPQDIAKNQTLDTAGFGAYGAVANAPQNLVSAVDKIPAAKVNGSLEFTDSDKRWLKDLGVTTTDPNSFHRTWETDNDKDASAHRKWGNTYGGRLGMRTLSRGIVGAVFYAAGNMYANKALSGYTPDKEAENVLQFIAKCIDKTAGKGIASVTKTLTPGSAEQKTAAAIRSVSFRDTVKNPGYKGMGRSLGHEVVGITFDFATMSFGDYMTRYALGLVDPNAKSHWMKEGHLDIPGGVKDLVTNLVRGVTYAAGEDIAVALPYVYGMRLQRNLINKSSPGYKFDTDRSLNGGSFKVKDGKVVGDYQLEGMLDLMGRFSWYNVGTKFFRDAYSTVQTKVENFQERWKKGDHSLPKPHIESKDLTPSSLLKSAGDAARYIVRTTIKVMGYMTPATFFFYITRTPQSKSRGLAIDQEGKGILGRDKIVSDAAGEQMGSYRGKGSSDNAGVHEGYSGDEKFKSVTPGSMMSSDLNGKRPADMGLYYLKHDMHGNEIRSDTDIFPFKNKATDAFTTSMYDKQPWYGKITSPIGKSSYKFGENTQHVIEKGADKINRLCEPLFDEKIKFNSKSREAIERFAHLYGNAAIAYTPYFMMKTDVLSAEWDNRRTDMAIDRTLDGAGKLNWGEFKAGFGEIMRAMMREPFTDPRREQKAQSERWNADSEHRSNEAYQITGDHQMRPIKDPDKAFFAHEGLKVKKFSTPSTFLQLKPLEQSWTAREREMMGKFQETASTSQSIH